MNSERYANGTTHYAYISRIQSLIDAVSEGHLNRDDIIQAANKIYHERDHVAIIAESRVKNLLEKRADITDVRYSNPEEDKLIKIDLIAGTTYQQMPLMGIQVKSTVLEAQNFCRKLKNNEFTTPIPTISVAGGEHLTSKSISRKINEQINLLLSSLDIPNAK